MNKRFFWSSIIILIVVSSCAIWQGKNKQSIRTHYMLTDVRPQDDFFMFANGQWIKDNPVPASESRWGSFNELDRANKEKLKAILNDAVKKSGNVDYMGLLGKYANAYFDETNRAAGKLAVEQFVQEKIFGANSKEEMLAVLAEMHMMGITAYFSAYVAQDLREVDRNVLYMNQAGIGLPNRDYYRANEKSKMVLFQQYVEYLGDLASQFNVAYNNKLGVVAAEMEQSLAGAMKGPAELRIPEANYHPMEFQDFSKEMADFHLEIYLRYLGISPSGSIVVRQPEYFRFFNAYWARTSLDEIKIYLTSQVLNHFAKHLTSDIVNLHFDFYGRKLSGIREMKSKEELLIEKLTANTLGEALGRAFVKRHFSKEAKEKVNEMVDNLLLVYRNRLENLDWMTSQTKNEALKKLNAIGRKLGYPDTWRDYEGLELDKHNHIHNVMQCAIFEKQENLNKFDQVVDRSEWSMPAHMVNAYYHPVKNEIVFPAGIMQAPFFDLKAEDAVNYGGIGMVIGHEFTHGFDDMGSKFAADGSLTDWWSTKDRKQFEERTQKLGQTFRDFCPIHEHCVNPELTMGENIADLGGVTMAYHAYTKTNEYKSGREVYGFSPSQRFFIAYAQLWKINYTDEELKKRLATDPHSPGMFRVNGPLKNSPEFFRAFDVQEGDPMRNPKEKISIIW
ncbi:MAG: M13 family metallopeptidase [Crocinitomicaceae bacterium]|nr:M13 family metallopeptidase [Crocinitomicaceae bacterium]